MFKKIFTPFLITVLIPVFASSQKPVKSKQFDIDLPANTRMETKPEVLNKLFTAIEKHIKQKGLKAERKNLEIFYTEQQVLIELLQSAGWNVQNDTEDSELYVMEKGEKKVYTIFFQSLEDVSGLMQKYDPEIRNAGPYHAEQTEEYLFFQIVTTVTVKR